MTAVEQTSGATGILARMVALLAGLALLSALALDPRFWEVFIPAEPVYEIAFEGRNYRVDSLTAAEIARRSSQRADLGRVQAEDKLQAALSDELDALFLDLHARLPDYADWYFSLRGEYTRLGLLLLQRFNLAGDDVLGRHALSIVFGEGELSERLEALESRAERVLGDHARELRTAWLEELLAVVGGAPPVAEARVPQAVLPLDGLAAELGGHGSSEFLTRVSFSAGVAGSGAAVAPLLARLATRPAGVAGAAGGLSAKGAGRGLARAGTVGASALGCAATGPAALACAVLVGGAAWVATDLALLSVDEWRHRDQLIADWEDRLDMLRSDLEVVLLERYARAIADWHDALALEVERSFSPLRSIRSTR